MRTKGALRNIDHVVVHVVAASEVVGAVAGLCSHKGSITVTNTHLGLVGAKNEVGYSKGAAHTHRDLPVGANLQLFSAVARSYCALPTVTYLTTKGRVWWWGK